MNKVFLIGLVTAPPSEIVGGVALGVGVVHDRGPRQFIERVRVVARGTAADGARALHAAQAVFIEGRLTSEDGLQIIEARTAFALGEAPPVEAARLDVGKHASPRPHERAAHPRRIHRGTPGERVVWVRATRVGAAQTRTPSSRSPTAVRPASS